MWADVLLRAERAHVLALLAWGVVCVLAGTALAALAVWRNRRAPLLQHFALQTALWGAGEAVWSAVRWPRLAIRDYAAAERLAGHLWLAVGLDIGCVATGAAIGITGWALARRAGAGGRAGSPAALGAGTGIVVQGTALFLLDAVLLRQLLVR